MKAGLERRLRNLEREYAAKLDPVRVVGIRWLTEGDIRRGRGPGLYYISEDDDISEDVEIAQPDEISEDVETLEDDVDSAALPDPLA